MDMIEKIPHTPTREQIDRLQQAMSLMPQADNMKTDHFFVPGMYCRRLWRAAGTVIVGKVHKAPHFFVCAAGEIIAWSETGMRRLQPGDVIESKPGTKRVTYAVVDSIGMTIHKTDLTDLDAIEHELIEDDDIALFDSDNQIKFDVPAFRELTKRVIASEKPGFWSDWTEEEQRLYTAGDWRAFSKSRGYSDEAITEYGQWRNQIASGKARGVNPLLFINDLATEAALKNIALDTKGEIIKSSHAPFQHRGVLP
jgi:hypothetical protein